MLPSVQDYIDAASRAIREVVRPAIAADEHFALEQLALVEGALHLIGQQWQRTYEVEALELLELGAMADQVLALMGDKAGAGGAAVQEVIRQIEAQGVERCTPYPELVALNTRLRDALSQLVDVANEDDRLRAPVGRVVVSFGAAEAERGRSWFAATGIDLESRSLPSIADMLTAARS